ncbi:MAG: hypothetical protein V4621_07875 [Pseudomonadota bacterium]
MILVEFLASPIRNAWLEEPGMAVYVRKAYRVIDGVALHCLDIANIEVQLELQRHGVFKNWLALAEKHGAGVFECVYVENVHNEHLPAFLERNGYDRVKHTPSYFKVLS